MSFRVKRGYSYTDIFKTPRRIYGPGNIIPDGPLDTSQEWKLDRIENKVEMALKPTVTKDVKHAEETEETEKAEEVAAYNPFKKKSKR